MSAQQLEAILQMAAQNPPPPQATPAQLRAWFDASNSRMPLAQGLPIQTLRIPNGAGGTMAAELLSTPQADPRRLVIYYHAGGFVFGSLTSHRALCSYLAQFSGAQVLNVAFGGTLWQDIPAQCRAAICHYQDSAARGELFHSLTLAPDSLLARIMGPGQHECNTFHHQAVRDVAPGFAAAAHAPDGLVEAVESADGLALGVQWHPENLAPEHPDHAAVSTWLVDAAAGGALLKR